MHRAEKQIKAGIRAIGEHPFRVIKSQFGPVKVLYREPVKNTERLHTLFALSKLWTVHQALLKATHA